VRLSDIMSSVDLSLFPQIGLLIFFAVFAGVVARVFGRSRPETFTRLGYLALEEGNHARTGGDQ
jgi:hypothetical protein